MKASIADQIQAALHQENLNGWQFYSFRGSDPIAGNILRLDHARLATRRWFYIVTVVGEPTKLVHAIESEMLDALPGEKKVYLPWQQIHSPLVDILAGSRRVAVQYSPLSAIWNQCEERDMTSSHRPIVAINSHNADPHYQPDRENNRSMNEGDFLLIDTWGRKRFAHSAYDDITWTGYIGRRVPDSNEAIFQVVKGGRDAAIQRYNMSSGRTQQRRSPAGRWMMRPGNPLPRRDTANGSFLAPDIPFTKKITAMMRISATLKLRTIAA